MLCNVHRSVIEPLAGGGLTSAQRRTATGSGGDNDEEVADGDCTDRPEVEDGDMIREGRDECVTKKTGTKRMRTGNARTAEDDEGRVGVEV